MTNDDFGRLASTLRQMVQHETEQVHRRLSWLGTFQGFLFASLGFTWQKSVALSVVISLLGLIVAVLVLVSVVNTVLAAQIIRRTWLKGVPKNYDGPGIFGFYPEWAPFMVFISPEVLLPVAFAIAWAAVLFIRLHER